jgi:predicted metal-dependent phosphoesterase TrpH
VTDHDTVGGCREAEAACRRRGLTFIPGIEMTSVVEGADVHVLGYFIDVDDRALHRLLAAQRRHRIDRVREIVARLARHGITLDADRIVSPALADGSKSAGRPWVARALVEDGHVATTNEAFSRWLERGKPAFVPRVGVGPRDVFDCIHTAGGITSLAHPGLIGHDEWIHRFVREGLDAIEVYHTEHSEATARHYLGLAARLEVAVTGGSDFHGDMTHGAARPGSTSLPLEHYERLATLAATRRATQSGSSTSS